MLSLVCSFTLFVIMIKGQSYKDSENESVLLLQYTFHSQIKYYPWQSDVIKCQTALMVILFINCIFFLCVFYFISFYFYHIFFSFVVTSSGGKQDTDTKYIVQQIVIYTLFISKAAAHTLYNYRH